MQRQLGIEAAKAEILRLVGQFRKLSMPPHAFARMMNVPPAVVVSWLAARQAQDVERLFGTDPNDRTAREYADYEDQITRIDERLAQPNIGDRVFANLTRERARLVEQRNKLLARTGLDQVRIDQRDGGAKALHADLAEMCAAFMEAKDVLEAAGIDPNFPTTPEGIAAARAEYADFRAEFPETKLPDFMEDDPYGWRPTEQRSRLIRARKLATGRKDQYGHRPGDLEPIPGVSYLPPDVTEIAEMLRQRAERDELETGCTEDAESVPA